MATYKCLIDSLNDHIDSNAILKFRNKQIILQKENLTNEETFSDLTIEEDSPDSLLKKLTIRAAKKLLKEGCFPNSTFICLDKKEENLSCFTHFVKKNSPNVRQKCDFTFIYKENNSIHVVISEMKSSRKGLNERCDGQFSRSKVFLKYLINLIGEVENINPTLDFYFYKLVFMPSPNFSIAISEPTTPVETSPLKLKKNDYTVFEVTTDSQGNAEINIISLVSTITKSLVSFFVKHPKIINYNISTYSNKESCV